MEQFHLSMWEPIAFFAIHIHLISSHPAAWVHQPLYLLTGHHFVSAFLSSLSPLSLFFLPFSSFFLSLFLSLTFSLWQIENSAAIRHNVSWLKWNRIELAFFPSLSTFILSFMLLLLQKNDFPLPFLPPVPFSIYSLYSNLITSSFSLSLFLSLI